MNAFFNAFNALYFRHIRVEQLDLYAIYHLS